MELIDTQWDGNKDDSEIVIPLTRINRYIVGCK